MMDNSTQTGVPPGGLRKWLWRPAARWSLATIFVAGGTAALILWGGFNKVMAYTNTPEFCVSCHEMGDNVGAEWMQSTHYKNASGVRAVCADCHVPKNLAAKLWRKTLAVNDIYHHLVGTIDTPEKFAAKRAELAETVWARMKANDSRACRSCHSYEAMDFHKQTPRGAEKMQEGRDQGKTCIECHTGVAHKRPPRDD